MKEERKTLFKEIKSLKTEMLDQVQEHTSAEEVLINARQELEKILTSKKTILLHLKKVDSCFTSYLFK